MTADRAQETVHGLLRASTAELEQTLAAAGADDTAMREPPAGPAPDRMPVPGTCEVVILGSSLGCRRGMLAGGAGGRLVRTSSATVLADPGPAALGSLLALARRGLFSWAELDAICVTHLHPDHCAGVILCLEGMATASPQRRQLLVNPTAAEPFTVFSPYHFGGMADLVTLARPDTDGDGDGEPAAKVGGITVHAIPALRLEEKGRTRAAIGLAYDTPGGGIWYTSDTSLTPDLPRQVTAHADASNIAQAPGRAEARHLESRDVPAIAAALHPRHILIHHYDAAYSSPRYRIAQAIRLQRAVDRQDLHSRILPSADRQRLTLKNSGPSAGFPGSTGDAGEAAAAYLQAQHAG